MFSCCQSTHAVPAEPLQPRFPRTQKPNRPRNKTVVETGASTIDVLQSVRAPTSDSSKETVASTQRSLINSSSKTMSKQTQQEEDYDDANAIVIEHEDLHKALALSLSEPTKNCVHSNDDKRAKLKASVEDEEEETKCDIDSLHQLPLPTVHPAIVEHAPPTDHTAPYEPVVCPTVANTESPFSTGADTERMTADEPTKVEHTDAHYTSDGDKNVRRTRNYTVS